MDAFYENFWKPVKGSGINSKYNYFLIKSWNPSTCILKRIIGLIKSGVGLRIMLALTWPLTRIQRIGLKMSSQELVLTSTRLGTVTSFSVRYLSTTEWTRFLTMFSQKKVDLKPWREDVEPSVKSERSEVNWWIGCKGEEWLWIGCGRILPASPSLEPETKRYLNSSESVHFKFFWSDLYLQSRRVQQGRPHCQTCSHRSRKQRGCEVSQQAAQAELEISSGLQSAMVWSVLL